LLVGSVNAASASLAEQVQDLCATAQALSAGNLSARASTASRGDLQTLKTGLNGAAEGLGALCIELRRVCQEVTSEGKLVAEMRHPNPIGEWQTAQEAVNRMLQKLASTVRSAAEHAERVLQGDYSPAPEPPSNGDLGAPARVIELLSRQQEDVQLGLTALIDGRFEDVPVRGDTQRELTLAQLSLRLKRDFFRSIRATIMEVRSSSSNAQEFGDSALSALVQSVGAVAGAYYAVEDRMLVRVANMGCEPQEREVPLRIGEGLLGRAAQQAEPVLLDDLDERGLRIRSGLLELTPRALLLFPLQREGRVIGVFELLFVNSSAITAQELLEYLAEDLVRGPEPRASSDDANNPRLRELEEELVIANTRLERMAAELQSRERTMRAATGT
jgi:HAMP domain-containing protein